MAKAQRDPKTGRFISKKEEERRKILEEHHPELDELFEDVPTPPTSDDYDFMKAIIIGIVAAVIGGLALAFIFS